MEKKLSKKQLKFADYEFSPMRREIAESTVNGGLAARGAIIAALTFGLSAFFADCFAPDVGFLKLIFFAVLWSAVFCAIFCGGKLALAGAGLGILSALIWLVISPGFVNYAINCLRCTLTTAGEIFVKSGYTNMSFLQIGYVQYGEAAKMNSGTFFMFSAVIALIVSALNMRKVLLIPTVLFSLIICAPGFTFNFISSNWGFAFIVLSLFALFAVKLFERCYAVKKEDKKRRSAMGGYLGITVAVIALICILIPAAATDGRWGDIPVISDPINVARDIVTSVISGDMPNLQEMGIIKNMDEHNSRVVSDEAPVFTGKSMLEVKRRSSSSAPAYMRGWVAAPSFDGSTWYSPSNDQTAKYNGMLSQLSVSAGYSEIYSPDYMTEAFFELLFAPDMMYDEAVGYRNLNELGFSFNRTDVSMELGSGTGNLLFLPSTSFISNGLSAFEDTKEYGKKAEQFYDGVLLTGWFNLNKSYSVTQASTNFSAKGSSENFFLMIEFANSVREFLRADRMGSIKGDLYEAYEDFVDSKGKLEEISSLIEIRSFYDRYTAMSDEEKNVIYTRYCDLTDTYTSYVNETYINTGYDNVFVNNIADNVRAAVSYKDSTHQIAMRAVQYIVSNYSYSLTPKAGTIPNLTAFERFIAETREGYCTHLATLLTLVLRELGIPARYVEGYLADGFSSDGDYYTAKVKDQNAHAWAEVYYHGYGWVVYEPTRNFAKAMYGTTIKVPGSSVPAIPDIDEFIPSDPTAPSETPDDIITEDPSEPVRRVIPWGKIFRTLAVIAVIGGGLYLLIKHMKEKADDAVYSRKKLLEEAAYGADADEYPYISHEINGTLLRMMEISGMTPEKGELPSEYAQRVDGTTPYAVGLSFEEIMGFIQKQEFGQGLNNDELRSVSEYTSAFWNDLYNSMSRPKRFWHRYITREL